MILNYGYLTFSTFLIINVEIIKNYILNITKKLKIKVLQNFLKLLYIK